MATRIEVKYSVATVSTDVDLTEWDKGYPDDAGVLNRAIVNLTASMQASVRKPEDIDAQIAKLQAEKAVIDSAKPIVTGK